MQTQDALKIKVTENFNNTLKTCSPELKIKIIKNFNLYLDKYNERISSGAERFNVAAEMLIYLQDTIDEVVNTTEIGKSIKCKKGCSFCCNINVDVSIDQAELLFIYANEKKINIDVETLKIQSKHNHLTWHKLPLDKRKCIFLSNEGTCKVYEYRPSNCRTHCVEKTLKMQELL